MDRECVQIHEALVETGGAVDRLGEAQRKHLAGCAACSRRAAAERGLGQLLEQALPPADEVLQQGIVDALHRAAARRRRLALLPVAVSLLVALAGAAMIGGVPGIGLLGLLPAWSSQGWMALIGAARDWQLVALTAMRALPSVLPGSLLVAAWLLTVAGLAGIAGVLRRWRNQLSWPRGD